MTDRLMDRWTFAILESLSRLKSVSEGVRARVFFCSALCMRIFDRFFYPILPDIFHIGVGRVEVKKCGNNLHFFSLLCFILDRPILTVHVKLQLRILSANMSLRPSFKPKYFTCILFCLVACQTNCFLFIFT